MKYLMVPLLLLSMSASAQWSLDHCIDGLIQIESSGNKYAVGDNGKAVGILQIHPIMVKECNRLLGREEFTVFDRLHVDRSRMMCRVFLSYQIYKWRIAHDEYPTQVRLMSSWNTGNIFKKANKSYIMKCRKQELI